MKKPLGYGRVDLWTSKLLIIYHLLSEKQAYRKKKEFTDLALVTASNFINIENGIRSYPDIPERRADVENNLNNTYNVNPLFWKGLTDQVFLIDPPSVGMSVPVEGQKLNFRNAAEKRKIVEEKEALQQKLEAAEQELSILREKLHKYEQAKKTDKKTDK